MTDDLLKHMLHRVQRFHEDDAGSADQRKQGAYGEHEAVELRQHHHDPVFRSHLQASDATANVREEVAMSEHGSLGTPGGARGVEQGGQLVLIAPDG
jgi:hypothetical protein